MSEVTPTSKRKADHIRINLEENVKSGLVTGLDRLRFEHRALPELDLKQIDLGLALFGTPLAAPVLISSMTGGTDQAAKINRHLALAAQAEGIALGLGSQRAAIEDASLAKTYDVRRYAPDIPLFANLGAVQLNYGYGLEQCKKAVDMIEADALILHLNALQEAIQPEGDSNFSTLAKQIGIICQGLPVPVIVKEVGWGISVHDAQLLVGAGVSVIDVAGAGGTSWSQVEMYRAKSESQARLAQAFIDWGIPTAEAVQQVHAAFPNIPIFATGGIRSGVDIAKCIALGATLGGMAGPFLEAAVDSPEKVQAAIQSIKAEMRIAMFASGCKDMAALRKADLVLI